MEILETPRQSKGTTYFAISERLQCLNIALLLNDVSEKYAKFETTPSSPQISTDVSHQIFQVSS